MMAVASLIEQPIHGSRDPSVARAPVPFVRGVHSGSSAMEDEAERASPLPFGLPALDEALPDGGLPRSAVVELSAPHGLARATTLALAACASAQAEARCRGAAATEGAWCAWIDASGTLFAPAAAARGVDLARLLVVRPTLRASGAHVDDARRMEGMLARVAVRVAQSGVFAVVVVDVAGVPGRAVGERLDRWATAVRRLALAIEKTPTTVLLLTDARAQRSMPLPVAMRIELERSVAKTSPTSLSSVPGLLPSSARASSHRLGQGEIVMRVAKDRRGRVSSPVVVSLERKPTSHETSAQPLVAVVHAASA